MPDAHYGLAACMFVGAALYTSVGHGGASSYIALMALFSVPAAVMRPTALALNIIVSTLGTWRYASAGFFRWRAIWPFMAGAV
ncbi:MAG: sulfite exporter TauE/SafE family protein, partial [Xanthobacteraceae bacterium]